MDSRKLACILAAGLGLNLVGTATSASADPGDVVVVGNRFDAEIHRKVSYTDLNLALAADQKALGRRISQAAWDICSDLSGPDYLGSCTSDAIASTDHQVTVAIDRAQREMAGLSVGPAVAISMAIGAR